MLNYTLSRSVGPDCSYAGGAGSIGTGGKRAGDHADNAWRQNSFTDAGRGDANGWSRKRHAASSATIGSRGSGFARVCFESFSPDALSATGTWR